VRHDYFEAYTPHVRVIQTGPGELLMLREIKRA